jgi:beta-1,4-mannooligosaccharide phosphorylase
MLITWESAGSSSPATRCETDGRDERLRPSRSRPPGLDVRGDPVVALGLGRHHGDARGLVTVVMPRRSALSALAAAAFVVAIGGCGTTSGPASATPVATQAATSAVGAATTAPTSGPRFTFDDDVAIDAQLTGLTDLYVNPGALIEADGTLHMYPNLFSQWPGRVRIPHLTSTDGGATWVLDEDAPVISSEDTPLANPGIDVSTGYVANDGTWVLVFETVSTSKPWVLGRVTAPGPRGPWTFDDKPILEPGPAGSFDAGGLTWPSVVEHGGEVLLYYAGFEVPQGGSGSIGLATLGSDGTWKKRTEPVLRATEKWEGRSLDRPRIVSTPNGLVMVYAGRDLTDRGIATSTDGITWTRIPGPAIERDDFPNGGRSWDAALLYRDSTLVYFLEIGSQTTAVYRATLTWP